VRKNGKLESAAWDEALDLVAAKLGRATAALASTRLPAEALSLFKQVFADKLGSSMVTSIEEHTTNAAQNRLAFKLGHSFEGALRDLQFADVVVAIGADLVANHQVAGFLVKRALSHGVKLIVIDTQQTEFTDLADVVLQLREGTDRELLLGLAGRISLERASQATGVSAQVLTTANQLVLTAKRPVFVYGKGLTRADSTEALAALRLLAQAVNGKLISTKGKANSAAAALYGLDQAFDARGAQAVYLALGDDEPSQRLIERVRGAPFVVVQASYTSPATELADVVLPVAMWAEQGGHYINLEGRVQEARAALTPPGSACTNAAALQALADRLGVTVNQSWRDGLSRVAAVNVE
jgi:anaerobic selenocysteine-containing dehydrogenase